jgi:hypothetical protein
MVQRKKLTPNPNRIGKKVNTRKSSRFGPRKKSAQSHSRGIRRRPALRATTGRAGEAAGVLVGCMSVELKRIPSGALTTPGSGD